MNLTALHAACWERFRRKYLGRRRSPARDDSGGWWDDADPSPPPSVNARDWRRDYDCDRQRYLPSKTRGDRPEATVPSESEDP